MTTILDTIVEHKRMEILKRKGRKPLEKLREMKLYDREPINVASCFNRSKPNIIAEFKRKSPSKGVISDTIINPVPVVRSYKEAGAVASSILTDRDFFGGSFKDLENTKYELPEFPLLRKDFIIDPYQVHESKAYGADMVLLIASILDRKSVEELTEVAVSIGMTVLLEVHNEKEIDLWNPKIALVGVNNRNLQDFSVDIERSVALKPLLPNESILLSESGIHDPADLHRLFDLGFMGFLIGERFMSEADPGKSLKEFVNQ